jgi:putative transposase
MPWLETSSVEQRERFIADDRRGLCPRAELCARYGISRKTGYKWLDRYHEEGRRGLRDRSHAPHHCPHRIATEIANLLTAARRKHPDWGAGKLLDWLAPRHPAICRGGVAGRGHRWGPARPGGVGEEAPSAPTP